MFAGSTRVVRSLISTVDVPAPVSEVYERWTRLGELPRLLGSVQSVRVTGDTSRWDVKIAGERRKFEAEVVERVPDVRIAWTTRSGEPAHAGVVSFHRLTADATRVTVQLDWEPVGLFDKAGDRLGIVERRVDADLRAFADAVAAGARMAQEPRPASSKRARPEDGAPGRGADSPAEVPPKGWFQILKRTTKQLKEDDVPVVAGGVAFFSFLALVPALAAIVSIYGLISDRSQVVEEIESFTGAMPRDVAQFIRDQVTSITEQPEAGLGAAVAIGIVSSLWAAAKGFQALISALNIAYDEEEERKGWKVKALSLAFTVAEAVVVAGVIAAMSAVAGVADDLGTVGSIVLGVLRWAGLFVLLVLGLAVVYRYAPDRDKPKWRWVSPGALVAALLLGLGSFGFAFYVDNFGSYGETYGPLGAIVVLLLWLYLAAYLIVLGAELDAELERQTAKDTTHGSPDPLGRRGAYAADTVAS